jgi:hypothetical protein
MPEQTEQNERDKLLPCPFCGSDASQDSYQDGSVVCHLVACSNMECDAIISSNYKATAESVRAKWNARSDAGYDAGASSASAWVRIENRGTLPQTDGSYLVALLNYRDGSVRYEIRKFEDGDWTGAFYSHIRLVAWMPIPLYTENENENAG